MIDSLFVAFLLVAVVLALTDLASFDRRRTLAERAMSPFGIFTVFFAFVYYVVPLLTIVDQAGRFDLFSRRTAVPPSGFVALVLTIAYHLSVRLGVGLRPPVPSAKVLSRTMAQPLRVSGSTAFALTAILFLSSLFFTVRVFGSEIAGSYQFFLANRISLLAGHGYVTRPLVLGVPLALLLVFSLQRVRLRSFGGVMRVLVFLAVVIVTFASNAVLGSRSTAVLATLYVLLPMFIVATHRGRTSLLRAFLLVAAVAVLVAYLGVLRSRASGGSLASASALSIGWTELVESTQREVFTSFGHSELLAYLVERRGEWSPAWGATYASALVLPVPRAWWEGKPLGGGPYLKNIVDPGSYDLKGRFNTSFTTGAPLEAFMNFGAVGVVLVGLLHGWVISRVAGLGTAVSNPLGVAIYVVSAFGVGMELVYGEFLMVIGRTGTMLTPLVLVLVSARLWKRRGKASGAALLPGGTDSSHPGRRVIVWDS